MIAVGIFIAGLFIGGFVNLLVYKVPRKQKLFVPLSYCHSCNSAMKPYDLVPVLSFVLNRGRCRYCGSAISWQCPLTELFTGLLILLLYNHMGLGLDFIEYSLLTALLLVMIIIDIELMIIPDILNLVGLLGGFLFLLTGRVSIISALIGFIMGGCLLLLFKKMNNGGIGGGDIKLAAVLGLIFGWQLTIVFLLLSFAAVTVVGLTSNIIKGRNSIAVKIPFGPFLAAGAYVTMLVGNPIISLYLQLLG